MVGTAVLSSTICLLFDNPEFRISDLISGALGVRGFVNICFCLVITGEGTSRICFLNLVCRAINPSTSLKSLRSFSAMENL